jgi:hypothetical protein
VEKAAYFESNNYKDVSTKELDTLLQWYDILKEKMKKADKVVRWREIRTNNTVPPELVGWTTEDEEEVQRIANREIDMTETYLDRYAALQKRNTVAAVLDFTGEEWETLKRLKQDNMVDGVVDAVTGNINNNDGALGMENGVTGEDYNEESVQTVVVENSNTFSLCLLYHISRPRHVGCQNRAYICLPMMWR